MKKRKRRKIPITVHAGIVIRHLANKVFQVDHYRNGKRERVSYRTLAEAKTHADLLAVAMKNEGTAALALTPAQRADAARALEILDGKATLVAAAEHWAKYNATRGGATVQELGERFIRAITGAGCRESTIAERRQKIARLCRDLGDRPAASITKDDLTAWMDAHRLAGATRDAYRRCYHAVFRYAVEERIVEHNPVAAIKPIRLDERLPVAFTVEAVRALMAAAEQYAPRMVCTLAVQFFAGLRPGEAMGLKWEDIDWTESAIRVMPETSKMRRSRHVDMNDTIKAWLAKYRRTSGPIGITKQCTFAYYMAVPRYGEARGLLKAAGVKWIKDGPRKTFASMHYATHQDAAKLAAILGHTGGLDVLFRHYRGLVKRTEAERYWKILPARESNIITLGAPA